MSERDLSAVDRGEIPAQTVRELVSACRQNVAGMGFDLDTLKRQIERDDPKDEVNATLARLVRHLMALDAKLSLAINADHTRRNP